jgi:hypothetical protein
MTNHHTQSSIHSWTEVGTQDRNPRFSQPLTEHCHSHTAVLGYSLFAGTFPRSNRSLSPPAKRPPDLSLPNSPAKILKISEDY